MAHKSMQWAKDLDQGSSTLPLLTFGLDNCLFVAGGCPVHCRNNVRQHPWPLLTCSISPGVTIKTVSGRDYKALREQLTAGWEPLLQREISYYTHPFAGLPAHPACCANPSSPWGAWPSLLTLKVVHIFGNYIYWSSAHSYLLPQNLPAPWRAMPNKEGKAGIQMILLKKNKIRR